jgi:hypothetical protein
VLVDCVAQLPVTGVGSHEIRIDDVAATVALAVRTNIESQLAIDIDSAVAAPSAMRFPAAVTLDSAVTVAELTIDSPPLALAVLIDVAVAAPSATR